MIRTSHGLARCIATACLLAVAYPAPALTAIVAVAATSPAPPPRPAVDAAAPLGSGVPEPAVWLLIAGALTVAGLTIRRRSSAPVVTS